jgi:hypothetical protein
LQGESQSPCALTLYLNVSRTLTCVRVVIRTFRVTSQKRPGGGMRGSDTSLPRTQVAVEGRDFFIKGHSPDFITFITKSQSLTTQDQTKHKERPPNRVQTRQSTQPPLLHLSKAPRDNPKEEGRDNSSQTEAPASHQVSTDKHLAQLHTVSTSLTKPTPRFHPFSFNNSLLRAKEVFRVFKQGSGEHTPAHCSINAPSP